MRVGPYEIVGELGRGGMAWVLLARDEHLDRPIALKILDPGLADDPGFRGRFLREAKIAAALEHPNVVPIYDTGDSEGLLYIAMRYVAGSDLRKVLDAGPIPPDRVLDIAGQVASALDTAHAAGLVHRDVKPGNVLLAEPPSPGAPEHAYLTDFGLVWRPVLAEARTEPGTILGTLDYAAPEQLQGRPLDGRADVYGLGAVVFECLTGTPPFRRESVVATIAAHLHAAPPLVSAVRPDLPPAIDAVLAQALAKAREDRHRTCVDLVTAVREGFHGGAAASLFVPGSPGGLPVPLTSFLGRAEEVADVMVAWGRARVVTLVGMGGAGKSRVAIETARRLCGDDVEISYVDLSSVPEGGAADAIAERLVGARNGVIETAVLDGCEHHVDELRELITELLAVRPSLRIVATSREPLRVSGEHTVPLGPLPLPTEDDIGVLASPAGALFWDRAAAGDPSLELDAAALRSVATICRSLDGIPLALELAASRVRSLSLDEIARRVATSTSLLSDRAAHDERHRSMAEVIRWSHDLLSDEAKTLFRRLAVFASVPDLADIEAVCGEGMETDVLIDALAELVDRSLLVLLRDGRRARYRLLGPILRSARERLEASDDAQTVRRRHAVRFLRPLAEEALDPSVVPAAEAREAFHTAEALDDAVLRILAGRAAVTLGDWSTAITLLSPLEGSDDPVVLEALGVALCKQHRHLPSGAAFAHGQTLLEAALGQGGGLAALAALAGTWKGIDDARARTLYERAVEIDDTDAYALGNLLEYEVEEAGCLDPVTTRDPQLRQALDRCRADIAARRNLPWARFDEAKFLALLDETLPSLTAYLLGVLASVGEHPIETSRRSIERLSVVAGATSAAAAASQLLRLAEASRTQVGEGLVGVATSGADPLPAPVVIIAGDSSRGLHEATVARGADVAIALEGFEGTIVAGGSTSGVSALAGDLGETLSGAHVVGYLPSETPVDVREDLDRERYAEVRRTAGASFGPGEPLRYWADVLTSGIQPSQVCVLGIGGGPLAAFEYRLALVLGARVGVLRETGREATELLSDPVWSAAGLLFEVPSTVEEIRRFLRRCDVLPADVA
jgi:serine/threonine-protein kinase